MLVTFGFPIYVQFSSNFPLISALYVKFPAFYADIFLLFSTVEATYVGGSPHIVSDQCQSRERTQCANKGGGGEVIQAANNIMQMCAQNYSGAQYIAPILKHDTGPPSGSRYCRVIWRQYMRIMR